MSWNNVIPAWLLDDKEVERRREAARQTLPTHRCELCGKECSEATPSCELFDCPESSHLPPR